MKEVIATVSSSFILSAVLVFLVLRLSHKKAWYDHINERKIHTGDIPRLGGLGFALAFIIAAAGITFFSPAEDFGLRFVPSLAALVIILITGFRDDFNPLRPMPKLFLQIIAALCVVIPGYTFHRLFYIDIGPVSGLHWLSYPVTVLWIVGITNAVNFIDGVDGLAAGVSLFAALAFAAIFFSFRGFSPTVLFCLSLAGVLAGFLVFNAPFPKARIFMGDGGAYFLGFTLSLLPLIEPGNVDNPITRPAALPVFYAAAILAIPIFDTIAAVWRRLRDHRRPDSPDCAHTHHKLLRLGLSAFKLDCLLWGLQILMGLLIFAATRFTGWRSFAVLCAAYAVMTIFFASVHFLNRRANLKAAKR